MASKNPAEGLAHVRPVRPLHFPVSEPAGEHLGQSRRHWDLCMLLAFLVRRLVTPAHSYGADQFVYWNARDRHRCLAPDVFVKLGVPDEQFDSWKTWERGVPELGIEILSPSDTPELWDVPEKLARYHELGVREIACFDVDARAGEMLRVWDLIEGDMVERAIEGDRTPCLSLGRLGPRYEFVVAPAETWPFVLRLAKDGELVPLDSEALERAARERDALATEREVLATERDEAHQRCNETATQRDLAVARVAELERELRRLKP